MGARGNHKQISVPVCSPEIFSRTTLSRPAAEGFFFFFSVNPTLGTVNVFALTSALQPLLMNVQIGWYAPVPQV